jgi:hypothetical protein
MKKPPRQLSKSADAGFQRWHEASVGIVGHCEDSQQVVNWLASTVRVLVKRLSKLEAEFSCRLSDPCAAVKLKLDDLVPMTHVAIVRDYSSELEAQGELADLDVHAVGLASQSYLEVSHDFGLSDDRLAMSSLNPMAAEFLPCVDTPRPQLEQQACPMKYEEEEDPDSLNLGNILADHQEENPDSQNLEVSPADREEEGLSSHVGLATLAGAQEGGDEDEEDEDAILGGRYWRHISPTTTAALDRLENIGDLACTLLHGHVVRSVAQRIRGTMPADTSESVLSEIAARVIVQSWTGRPNLWKLLQADYQGLVDLFADMIAEAIATDPG